MIAVLNNSRWGSIGGIFCIPRIRREPAASKGTASPKFSQKQTKLGVVAEEENNREDQRTSVYRAERSEAAIDWSPSFSAQARYCILASAQRDLAVPRLQSRQIEVEVSACLGELAQKKAEEGKSRTQSLTEL